MERILGEGVISIFFSWNIKVKHKPIFCYKTLWFICCFSVPSRQDRGKDPAASQSHVTIDNRAETIKDKSSTGDRGSRPTTPEPTVPLHEKDLIRMLAEVHFINAEVISFIVCHYWVIKTIKKFWWNQFITRIWQNTMFVRAFRLSSTCWDQKEWNWEMSLSRQLTKVKDQRVT